MLPLFPRVPLPSEILAANCNDDISRIEMLLKEGIEEPAKQIIVVHEDVPPLQLTEKRTSGKKKTKKC